MNEMNGIVNTIAGYSIHDIKGESIYEEQTAYRHGPVCNYGF